MTTHLVTFSDESMSRAAELCVESAKQHGVGYVVQCRPAESTTERGCGFWKWKPRIILGLMNNVSGFTDVKDNDIVIYSDAGIEFINNVNYIIDRMDQDIWLFGNMYEHAHWCKRDVIDEVWKSPSDYPADGYYRIHPWEMFGKQVQASVIFFRVNDHTRGFVKEWLDWCLFEGGRLIDDSPSRAPNHPEFRENRHDQAILTTMAYRNGIKLHYWPAQYNDGAFEYPRGNYPDEGYPILFHHHRKRNHEWSQKQVA